MSSLFLELKRGRWLWLAAPIVAVAPRAHAADTYFIPSIDAGVEQYRDRDVSVGEDGSIESYVVSLGGIFGARSPRGLTEIQPIVELERYPSNSKLGSGSQYLNIKSAYAASQRTDLGLVGRFSREESIDTELTKASFDEFDPDDPTVDQTGVVTLVSERKTRLQLRPTFGYELSQKMSLNFNGLYQTVSYDSDLAFERVEYDTKRLDGFLRWRFAPRTGLRAGVYSDRYETSNETNTTTGQGVTLGIDHRWSQVFSMDMLLSAERAKARSPLLTAEDESNNLGLTLGVVRRGEISQFRLSAGRSYSPSSIGARTQLDQVWTQYNRDITQRWRFQGAARGYRSRAQGFDGVLEDRNYARGELEVTRELSQKWSATAYYFYTWREEGEGSSSDRNRSYTIGLQIGYQGLAPQR